ncbi:MAG: hypothetical protein ACRC8A_14495 [Microcoleaceae cyanobacterium]
MYEPVELGVLGTGSRRDLTLSINPELQARTSSQNFKPELQARTSSQNPR